MIDRTQWLLATYGSVDRYLNTAARRRIACRDPLTFALTYLPHHLRSAQTGGLITLASVHYAWARAAAALAEPGRPAFRRADIAPRETGKSTWHFLVIPLWAAAAGHTSFIAAFGDTASRAEQHLATFTHELQTNTLLRADFPELCEPLVRDRGRTLGDRVDLYRAANGFNFSARGMETQALGMKIGSDRPDFILLDDIEPAEERYSADSVTKRLRTLQDTVLPLNDRARVQLVGTVTRQGSIVHQLVRVARGLQPTSASDEAWVRDDGWDPRYHAPFLRDEAGRRVSFWPERWSTAELERIEHTRSFAKNFANDPVGADGDYWTVEDFRIGELVAPTRTLLSIDPATTTKQTSDFTGYAVVEWEPDPTGRTPGRCRVKRAWHGRHSGEEVRDNAARALSFDERIGMILVETNQGGELWERLLKPLPVPVRSKHQTVAKEVRAASVHDHYQGHRVLHAPGLGELQAEQAAFPRGAHDDMVDAVGSGVAYFLDRKPQHQRAPRQMQYAR